MKIFVMMRVKRRHLGVEVGSCLVGVDFRWLFVGMGGGLFILGMN